MNSFTSSVRQTKLFNFFPLFQIDCWRLARLAHCSTQYESNHWWHLQVKTSSSACNWRSHHSQDVFGRQSHQRGNFMYCYQCYNLFVSQNAMRQMLTQNCFAPALFSHRQLATIASIIFNGFRTKYALAYCYCVNRWCYWSYRIAS